MIVYKNSEFRTIKNFYKNILNCLIIYTTKSFDCTKILKPGKNNFYYNCDENDGYFDHVIPFSPPSNPNQTIDVKGKEGVEDVNKNQEYLSNRDLRDNERIEGTIGLGFRVPIIIASPLTKGGFVNFQVSDYTSVLQFLENFIQKKYNKRCSGGKHQ